MSTYLIYFPRATSITPEIVRAAGMAEFGSPTAIASPGPDGGQGMLGAYGNIMNLPALAYQAEQQRWEERGEYWLGIYNELPPTPEGLLRPAAREGGIAKLSDGNLWTIPVPFSLPHRWRRGGVREALPQFADYCERAAHLIRLINLDSGTAEMPIGECFAFAAAGLSINYYVTEDVIDFLGLLDDESFPRLMSAAFEQQIFMEVAEQKKN